MHIFADKYLHEVSLKSVFWLMKNSMEWGEKKSIHPRAITLGNVQP